MSDWTWRRVGGVVVVCLSMVGLLGACGGAPTAALPSTVDVQLHSFGIEASTPRVKAGKVTFNALNKANDVQHEMLVVRTDSSPDALPYDIAAGRLIEDQIDSLGEITELDAGKSGTVTLDLKPGHYLLLCNIATHFKNGMVVPLEVQ